MGLKDELVVENKPDDETGKESGDAAVETEGSAAEQSQGESSKSVEPEATVKTEEPTEEEPESEEEEEEEEVVDPMDGLREQCTEHGDARKLKTVWDECTERVSSKQNTTETCTQEIFDFLHCVDHCVSKTIFSHLK